MRRRSPVELEVNHDRWLVSYSDFVTLLFAFFVVMYSISQVNEGKYRVLSSTLLEAFRVPQSAISPIQVGDPSLSTSPSAIDIEKPQSADQSGADQSSQTAQQEQGQNLADLSELAGQFSQQFADLVRDDLLSVNANELWLELELKDSILFPTGSAAPSLQAKAIFEEVAQMMSGFDNPIQVEGFTDNVPINNRRFSSNWELSAARSASVVKILANNGVSPRRLAAVGYGEHQPAADNGTAAGRAQNRRVVLMIAKDRSLRPQLQDDAAVTAALRESEVVDLNAEATAAETDTLDNPLAEPSTETTSPNAETSSPIIDPVRLRDGGLLFTNDPDLPRNNSVEQSSGVEQSTDVEQNNASEEQETQ